LAGQGALAVQDLFAGAWSLEKRMEKSVKKTLSGSGKRKKRGVAAIGGRHGVQCEWTKARERAYDLARQNEKSKKEEDLPTTKGRGKKKVPLSEDLGHSFQSRIRNSPFERGSNCKTQGQRENKRKSLPSASKKEEIEDESTKGGPTQGGREIMTISGMQPRTAEEVAKNFPDARKKNVGTGGSQRRRAESRYSKGLARKRRKPRGPCGQK